MEVRVVLVLVTGHQGYIGTVLVEMLRSAGHTVRGLDIGYFAGRWCGPATAEPESAPVDLRDVEIAHCAGADAVIHLAALSNDPLGALHPWLTDAINVQASARLARAAKAAGVQRFLFSSSCSVYGAGSSSIVTEDDPTGPLTGYATSKLRTEADLSTLADKSFAPTYLRNATAYGYSPRLRTDLVVNDLTVTALASGQVRLRSHGDAWRPLVHVEDIAQAFTVLLEAPTDLIRDRVYNVGTDDENYLVRDIAEIIVGVIPGSALSTAADAVADKRSYRVDFTRIAREIPAFTPRWTVRSGAAHLAEALTRTGLPPERFAGPAYRRLDQLHHLIETGLLTTDLRLRERVLIEGVQ
jgi:nucleoside-diphosphate-sugar epimerase